MSFDDWLLALHVLSAFALVGAMVLFWVMIVALRRNPLPESVASAARLSPIGRAVIGVGVAGTLIFGIWLAIALDGVKLWNGWVIAALILWALGTETGRRSGTEYDPAFARAKELVAAGKTEADPELTQLVQTSRGLMLHSVSSLIILLILIDMIWKPGA
jgi:hypothetical protein